MSETLKESLSAAMDDEADEFELRRVLDEMGKDPALRETWERYHLVGRFLRREPMGSGSALRERVWAAIEDGQAGEDDALVDVSEAPLASQPRQWLGRITGMAVAATVAFAIIFGAGIGEDEPAPDLAEVAVSIEGPKRMEPTLGAAVSASDLQRANAYMMHHVQHKALNQPGVTSFVKLVTFEDQ